MQPTRHHYSVLHGFQKDHIPYMNADSLKRPVQNGRSFPQVHPGPPTPRTHLLPARDQMYCHLIIPLVVNIALSRQL